MTGDATDFDTSLPSSLLMNPDLDPFQQVNEGEAVLCESISDEYGFEVAGDGIPLYQKQEKKRTLKEIEYAKRWEVLFLKYKRRDDELFSSAKFKALVQKGIPVQYLLSTSYLRLDPLYLFLSLSPLSSPLLPSPPFSSLLLLSLFSPLPSPLLFLFLSHIFSSLSSLSCLSSLLVLHSWSPMLSLYNSSQ